MDKSRPLYHGTDKLSADNIRQNGIDLNANQGRMDFGDGFYLTNSRPTALRRAADKADSAKSKPDVVTCFLDTNGLSLLKFPVPDDEWKEEIYRQRILNVDNITADVVIGPIADGGINIKVREAIKGNIVNKDEFFKLLGHKTLGTQFVIKTKKATKQLTIEEE